ncbi:hypothetical protein NHP190020_04320 [Helicobacter suis]|uniref:Uncharacterized protein n=1 Tax=Helicobacter suis TaxID=104628 RepID=A0ABM7KY21_9HELI|nr:hypothetical protein [Helicobacter suis]BCD45393.1 hypothetical protein NHP190020_04320 [Helicobacter suis]BCD51959.1 hypothetical protein NHP194022_16300 [Helicobacter suis]
MDTLDKVYLLEQVPTIKTKMQKKRIQAFIPLRDALHDLIQAELNPLSTDGELETKRKSSMLSMMGL